MGWRRAAAGPCSVVTPSAAGGRGASSREFARLQKQHLKALEENNMLRFKVRVYARAPRRPLIPTPPGRPAGGAVAGHAVGQQRRLPGDAEGAGGGTEGRRTGTAEEKIVQFVIITISFIVYR